MATIKLLAFDLAALPANYEQQDYAAQVYTHRRFTNFDTLRYEAEYVSQVLEPAGHRDFNGGFLMMGPRQKHRVQEVRKIEESKRPVRMTDLMVSGQGFLSSAMDPVRISPLFKKGRWRKYTLRLDSVQQVGPETVYVLSFAVKRATHRSTGTSLVAKYSGRFYVRQRDYAVVRYEALWETDTAKYNAVALKYKGRNNLIAKLYNTIFTESRTDHVVRYQQQANGRYRVASSVAQGVKAGRVLGKAPHHYQMLCEAHFTPLPPETAAIDPNKEAAGFGGFELHQLFNTKSDPAFWQTYRRPAPATGLWPRPAAKP